MQTLRITRARDGLDFAGPRPVALAVDLSPLAGTWINFDAGSTGIARVEIAARDGRLAVWTFGAGNPDPIDWGEVVGQAFTDGVGLRAAVAFRAVYDFGPLRVMLACYLNKRLLVVDAYTVFQDGSGRSPYFQRDHFYVP
ncbi:MAG TPA: hypothetical protein VGG03_24385 [Thermoanaerobaculia bacterium]|jgi:hypothetical protein